MVQQHRMRLTVTPLIPPLKSFLPLLAKDLLPMVVVQGGAGGASEEEGETRQDQLGREARQMRMM